MSRTLPPKYRMSDRNPGKRRFRDGRSMRQILSIASFIRPSVSQDGLCAVAELAQRLVQDTPFRLGQARRQFGFNFPRCPGNTSINGGPFAGQTQQTAATVLRVLALP